jgi:hypothetical protein
MKVVEALRHLDARRAHRLNDGAAGWTIQDATAVATVQRYIAELEAEHPTTSRFARNRLDRADT